MGTQKDKDKNTWVGKDGHILLAVAQRGQGNVINTRIMDSSPGYIAPDRIRGAIRKLSRRMGWLAKDPKGRPAKLNFQPVFVDHASKVPSQESSNCCGVHTVLNAWRYMLRLPAIERTSRLNQPEYGSFQRELEEQDFINHALEMVNLALAGLMDFQTIQAFFNHFGFCALQNPHDQAVLLPADMTARTNRGILEQQLEEDRTRERNLAQVQRETGLSADAAAALLLTAGGEPDVAKVMYDTMPWGNA